MLDVGLLVPGVGDNDPDDVAVLRAMLRVESAWTRALAASALISAEAADALDEVVNQFLHDDISCHELANDLSAGTSLTGNPVIPLVQALKREVPKQHRDVVHAGLTSQDVLDTALVLVVSDAARAVDASLTRARDGLVSLATAHRDTPALARTLSQAALPTTFGARVAIWLQASAESNLRLQRETQALPVAFGGAVGTMAAPAGMGEDVDMATVIAHWADSLGLAVTAAPWHVARFPVLRIAAAFAEVCAAAGKIAADVLLAARPEVGELSEDPQPGKGGSSAMSFKNNPVYAVTIKRSAITAPHLLAQVHAAAGLSADERPDGAWHSEWEPLRALARHAVISATTIASLVENLRVDVAAMARNLEAHGNGTDTGNADVVVDRAIAQYGSRS